MLLPREITILHIGHRRKVRETAEQVRPRRGNNARAELRLLTNHTGIPWHSPGASGPHQLTTHSSRTRLDSFYPSRHQNWYFFISADVAPLFVISRGCPITTLLRYWHEKAVLRSTIYCDDRSRQKPKKSENKCLFVSWSMIDKNPYHLSIHFK